MYGKKRRMTERARHAAINGISKGMPCPIFSLAKRSLKGTITGSDIKNRRAYSRLSSGTTKNCSKTRPSIEYVAIPKYTATTLAKM